MNEDDVRRIVRDELTQHNAIVPDDFANQILERANKYAYAAALNAAKTSYRLDKLGANRNPPEEPEPVA